MHDLIRVTHVRPFPEDVQDDELDEMLDEDDEVGELSGGQAAVGLAATRKELTYQV